MLLSSLRVPLPSLEGLPRRVADDLERLEALDDEALRAVAYETVGGEEPIDIEEVEALLEKSREGTLADPERERLSALRRAADTTMLRKARAAVLLRFRGRQVPAVSELRARWAPEG